MEFTGFEGNDKMWRHKDLANLERLLRRREGLGRDILCFVGCFFFFWIHGRAYGTLVPPAGIETTPCGGGLES